MKRHALKIAAFAFASVALGSLLTLTVPTDLRTAPNSKLDQLSAPQIVDYPGTGHVINGQDSYPVVYSRQYLAAAGAAERARLMQSEQSAAQDYGYDQPDPARNAVPDRDRADAVVGEVTVRRGSTSDADGAPDERAQLSDEDAPEG